MEGEKWGGVLLKLTPSYGVMRILLGVIGTLRCVVEALVKLMLFKWPCSVQIGAYRLMLKF